MASSPLSPHCRRRTVASATGRSSSPARITIRVAEFDDRATPERRDTAKTTEPNRGPVRRALVEPRLSRDRPRCRVRRRTSATPPNRFVRNQLIDAHRPRPQRFGRLGARGPAWRPAEPRPSASATSGWTEGHINKYDASRSFGQYNASKAAPRPDVCPRSRLVVPGARASSDPSSPQRDRADSPPVAHFHEPPGYVTLLRTVAVDDRPRAEVGPTKTSRSSSGAT